MGWAGKCKLGRYKKNLHEKVAFRLPTKDEKEHTGEECSRKETGRRAEEGMGSLRWRWVRAKQGT